MKTLVILLVFVATCAVAALSYFAFFVFSNKSTPTSDPITVSEELPWNQANQPSLVKIVAPFHVENSSQAYGRLQEDVYALMGASSGRVSSKEALKRESVYTSLLSFARDERNSSQERAYALNLLNLLFTIGFDAQVFKKGIGDDKELSEVYDLYLSKTTNKKKKSNGMPGVMYATGAASENYAAQKTMAEINALSHSLYPNAYAYLRKNHNTVQAEIIYYSNFSSETSFSDDDIDLIIADALGDDYVATVLEGTRRIKAKGDLYKDTFASSYEIDIMYATGVLWPAYLASMREDNNESAREALLKEYLVHLDHMVTVSDEYNTGNLFFGYVISAFNKARLAQSGGLDSAFSRQLTQDAQSALTRLLRVSTNEQLFVWLRALPKTGWMYKEFKQLSDGSPQLKTHFDSIYTGR